jgi:hypothetical protein
MTINIIEINNSVTCLCLSEVGSFKINSAAIFNRQEFTSRLNG